jgi:transmembrane sensor
MTAGIPEPTQQAAYWVIQLRSPEPPPNADRDFADWLRASPIHVREYLRAVEVWEGLGHPATFAHKTLSELVSDAGADTNLVELPSSTVSIAASPARPRKIGLRRIAVAAAVCATVCVAFVAWRYLSFIDVATTVGEQRSAVLPDRSIVELNTQSEIRVAFTAAERRVELVRGEAFFEVSKDPARPFIVSTDLATARALGTHFSVYRRPNGTIVTVTEGRVLVGSTGSPAGEAGTTDSVEVVPGTSAEARPGHSVQMRQADLERALAWRQRRLIFAGESLANAVDEFNRYNSLKLVIVDPRLRDQRISGVFDANDPESLLDFLAKVDHINVKRSQGRVVSIGEAAP